MTAKLALLSDLDPAFEAGLSGALLDYSRGSGESWMVVGSAAPAIYFSRLDQLSPGYSQALACTARMGIPAVRRLSGGRAVAAHPGVLRILWSAPHPSSDLGVAKRFDGFASLLEDALLDLGLSVERGELPGEFCPGDYSLHAGGRKLVGLGQRSTLGAHHICAMVSLSGAEQSFAMLAPVYDALSQPLDPLRLGDLSQMGVDPRGAESRLYDFLTGRLRTQPEQLPAGVVSAAQVASPEYRLEPSFSLAG